MRGRRRGKGRERRRGRGRERGRGTGEEEGEGEGTLGRKKEKGKEKEEILNVLMFLPYMAPTYTYHNHAGLDEHTDCREAPHKGGAPSINP